MTRSSGMTAAELLVVIAVLAIFAAAATMYFRPSEGSLQDSTALFEGFMAQARARSMATTSARRVRPSSSTRVVSEAASSCSATTWASDAQLDLPASVTLVSTSWSICFGDRGTSTANFVVGLQRAGVLRQVEILLGGTTRVLP